MIPSLQSIDAERILALAQRLVEAKVEGDGPMCRTTLKRLLAAVWCGLPWANRQTFLSCLDDDKEFVPPVDLPGAIAMDVETALILRDWPEIAAGVDEDLKDFAVSILAQMRRRDWTPSAKQERLIHKLAREARVVVADASVIDDEEAA